MAPDLKIGHVAEGIGHVAEGHVADLVLLDRELASTTDLTEIDQAVTMVLQGGSRVL